MKLVFTISDLQRIAHEITGNSKIVLDASFSSNEVLGWDSLNHTLIMIQVSTEYGIDINIQETAECGNFGEVVALINQLLQENYEK